MAFDLTRIPSNVRKLYIEHNSFRAKPTSKTSEDEFTWCLHYMVCCAIADDFTLGDGSSEYLVLEGKTREEASMLIRAYLPANSIADGYTPDIIRKGTDAEGKAVTYPRSSGQPAVKQPPLAIEVGVAYLSLAEKLASKIAQTSTSNVGIVVVSIDGDIADQSKKILNEKQQFLVKDILCKYRLCIDDDRLYLLQMIADEMDVMPDLTKHNLRHDFFDFEFKDWENDDCFNKAQQHIRQETSEFTPCFRDTFPEIMHYDGSSILTGGDSSWRKIIPIDLAALPSESTGKNASILEIIQTILKPMRPAKNAFVLTRCFQHWANTKLVRKPKSYIEQEKVLFRIGKKREIEKSTKEDYKMYDTILEPRKYEPWISEMAVEMTTDSQFDGYQGVHRSINNDMDAYLVETAETFESMCRAQTDTYARLVSELYTGIMSFSLNNFDIAFHPLYLHKGVQSFPHGFWVKGPAHPKSESSQIPYVVVQLIKESRFFKTNMYKHKTIYNTTVPGIYAVVTVSHCSRIQAQTWASMLRYKIPTINMAVSDWTTISAGFTDAERYVRSPANKKLWRLMMAESVLFGVTTTAELEGGLANLRRIIHQALAILSGKAVMLYPGASPEAKLQECVIGNVMLLYMVYHYNTGLRVEADTAAEFMVRALELTPWSSTVNPSLTV